MSPRRCAWTLLGLAAACGSDELPVDAGDSPEAGAVRVLTAPRPATGFRSCAEIQERFETLASRRPDFFRSSSLGASVQGRPLPMLAVSDFHTDGHRTGMWVDGAIHGFELASAEPALALAERIDAEIEAGRAPAFLRRVVLYLVPVINVDARHAASTPPFLRQRTNLCPRDDDGDGACDEDGPVDVNGDGVASMMESGSGRAWEARDQDGDGHCGEDPPGGIDLNRNFPVQRAPGDNEATPIQPETRAIVDFWLAHPEIEVAISYHTSADGYILPPVPIAAQDRPLFERIAGLYAKHTGCGPLGEAGYVPPPEQLRGMTCDWFYTERSAVALVIEFATQPLRDSISPPLRTLRLACFGEARVPFLEPDAPLESGLQWLEGIGEETVRQHVDFLIEIAEALPLRS